MKFFFLTFSLVIAPAVVAQSSYIPFTKLLKHKGHEINLSGDFFQTSELANAEGKREDLPEGESFRRSQGEVNGFYGVTNNLQLGLGVRYRMNDATRLNSSGAEYTVSSNGVQSTLFDLKYGFKPIDRMSYTLEGTFRYTPYTNEESGDIEQMVLGDDGNELSAGIGATYSSRTNNFLTGRIGYRKPGRDLSDELYWRVEGALAWRYVALVAGVDGVTSLNNDPFADSPGSRPNLNVGNTLLYNSSKREWIAPYGGVNFAWGDKWRLELRGSQVVMGNSTDLGTVFGITLARRVDTSTSQFVDSRFKEYDLEVSVTKISPKKEYLVIDKGLTGGVQKGMKFDFFEFDYVGGNVLIARGTVIQTKSESAIVKLTQRFNSKKEIKEGLVGRASYK